MVEFLRWLRDWDYRPLTRLLIWVGIAAFAAHHYQIPLPDPASVLRELVMGWLLSFGLLTWVQIRLAAGAWWLFLILDEWTYALSAHTVRSLTESASFGVGFLVTLPVQLALVLGTVALFNALHGGARLLALLDAALRAISG